MTILHKGKLISEVKQIRGKRSMKKWEKQGYVVITQIDNMYYMKKKEEE